jgi:hypothetical protein
MERQLSRRTPLIGISLALDQPRISEAAYGYPYDPRASERIAASHVVRLFRFLPGPLRLRVLRSLPMSLTAAAVYAGPPSVGHAEALLRAIDLRSAVLDEQLDVLCMGIPRTTPHLPRERPNPLLSTYIGLGLASRLWREQPPLRDSGTAILVHRFHRRFSHPTQQPYRAFFQSTRAGLDPDVLEEAELLALADVHALRRYREGRACHPLLPYADWAAIRPEVERLSTVIVGGCRDAAAARQLGFVPSQSVGTALEMALGASGDGARVGFLLAPPYFPIRVSS